MNTIPKQHIKHFLMAASVALAVPLSAFAHGGDNGSCGMEMGMGGGGMHQLHALNLTEAQRDKVFDIMHTRAPAMHDKMKAVRKANEDLRGLTNSPDYSDAKAKELTDAAAKAMADMALLRVQSEHRVYEVLTPEQRKQLAETKPMDGKQRPMQRHMQRQAPAAAPQPGR